ARPVNYRKGTLHSYRVSLNDSSRGSRPTCVFVLDSSTRCTGLPVASSSHCFVVRVQRNRSITTPSTDTSTSVNGAAESSLSDSRARPCRGGRIVSLRRPIQRHARCPSSSGQYHPSPNVQTSLSGSTLTSKCR